MIWFVHRLFLRLSCKFQQMLAKKGRTICSECKLKHLVCRKGLTLTRPIPMI